MIFKYKILLKTKIWKEEKHKENPLCENKSSTQNNPQKSHVTGVDICFVYGHHNQIVVIRFDADFASKIKQEKLQSTILNFYLL